MRKHDPTRVDRILRRLKDHKLTSVAIVIAVVLIGLGTLTDSITKIGSIFSFDPSRKNGASGEENADTTNQDLATDIAEDLSKSSVMVTKKSKGWADTKATGFFIERSGTIISFASDVQESDSFYVEFSNGSYDAKVVKFDETNDLILLQADLDHEVVSIPIPNVDAGRETSIFAVGYTKDGLFKSSGQLLGAPLIVDDHKFLPAQLTNVNGMAGGPVVDDKGTLIGMIVGRHLDGYTLIMPLPVIRQFLANN